MPPTCLRCTPAVRTAQGPPAQAHLIRTAPLLIATHPSPRLTPRPPPHPPSSPHRHPPSLAPGCTPDLCAHDALAFAQAHALAQLHAPHPSPPLTAPARPPSPRTHDAHALAQAQLLLAHDGAHDRARGREERKHLP